MSNIDKRVWMSSAGNNILFGIVKEERFENSWLMVNVEWCLPEGRTTDLTAWQKFASLGDVMLLERDLEVFREDR